MMLKHRCPWCGEKIKSIGLKSPTCKNCGSRIHIMRKQLLIAAIILFLTAVPFARSILIRARYTFNMELSHRLTVLYSVLLDLCILCFAVLLNKPYTREKKRLDAKKTRATLRWSKGSDGGLFFPRWQAPNGEIFPACFMDADGTPISTALCIVLDNIKWSGLRRCSCEIQFVLDDIDTKNYFKKGNRFYLYYDYRKIAEGFVE